MKCLICNSENLGILTDTLRDGSKRSVYFCKKCELGMLRPDKTHEELKKYYKENYRKEFTPKLETESSPEELFKSYVEFQENRLKIVEPFLNKNKSILEIGCSAGMFLYHIKDRVKDIYGIDYDSKSAEYASKKCGCEVYSENINDTPLRKKSLDLICLFQVLEHVEKIGRAHV